MYGNEFDVSTFTLVQESKFYGAPDTYKGVGLSLPREANQIHRKL